MSSIADDLKQARERSGLTINDLVARTRIGRASLEALERGDYDQLPGEVFIVGFIRSYAREVGVDDDEAVRRYKEEMAPQSRPQPSVSEVEAEAGPSEEGHGNKDGSSGLPLGYVALAALLLAIVAAVVYFTAGKDEPVTTTRVPSAVTPPPAKPPVKPVPETKPVSEATEEPFAGATTIETPLGDTPPPEASGPAVVLDIHVVSSSWIAYEADEKPYRILGVLAAGRVVRIEADEYILMDTGNAGGIEISYNGEPLGAMGPSGAVRKNVLYSAGARGATGRPRVPRPVIPQDVVEGTALEPHTLPGR